MLVHALQGSAKGLEQKRVRAVKFLTAAVLDCLLDIAAGQGYQKTKTERSIKMDPTLLRLVEVWKAFSVWTSTQPTFLQVAFGMGLFYLVLQLWRLVYRISIYIFTGLFAGRGRPRPKKDLKPPNRAKKQVAMDDDAPPFVFR